MSVQTKPLSEITQQALTVLMKEMGGVNTVRFLNKFTVDYRDYIAEHDAMFADLTLDAILTAIKQRPEQR